jgi:hypothetical protein
MRAQNMAGKTECKKDPKIADAKKDVAPENISLTNKRLQKAKQTLEDIQQKLNISQWKKKQKLGKSV